MYVTFIHLGKQFKLNYMKSFISKLEYFHQQKKWFRRLTFVFFTLIPAFPTYAEFLRNIKIKISMNIMDYIPQLIYLLVIGLALAFLFNEYMRNRYKSKQLAKTSLDHSIRLRLYQSIINWIILGKNLSELHLCDIITISDNEKLYLGYTLDEVRNQYQTKFKLPDIISKVLEDKEAWTFFNEENVQKNKLIQ